MKWKTLNPFAKSESDAVEPVSGLSIGKSTRAPFPDPGQEEREHAAEALRKALQELDDSAQTRRAR